MNMNYKKILSYTGLFYAAVIWGSTFFIVKNALDDIDPVILVGYRFLLAGIIMLPFIIMSGKNILSGIMPALVLGFFLWLLYIPQTIGLKYTTASNSGFITGLFVVFIPLFQRYIFKRKPNPLELIAVFVSLCGLWILTGSLKDINLGDILTLAAALTYALHVLYSDRYMKSGIDPYVLCCQQFLIVGTLSILCGFILDLPFAIGTEFTVGVVLFLALFPTLSAFLFQMMAQKTVPPVKVSLIFALEPVFAAAFAWTLGGEIPVLHRALGGTLIFAALIISGLPLHKKYFLTKSKP